MTLLQIIAERWQDYKAWKRGERRIAPRGSRGRVYERIEPHELSEMPGGMNPQHIGTIHLKARHIHADGSPDTFYDLGPMTKGTDNG